MKIKEHLGQAVVYQQIDAAFPGGRSPCLLVMPPPMLRYPGGVQPQMAPGVRPPVLPIPGHCVPGYGTPPVMQMQPPPNSTFPPPPGGLPAPPSTSTPPCPSTAPQMFSTNPTGTAPNASATTGNYSYTQASETSH